MAADKDMKLRLLIEAKNDADDELKKLQREIGATSAETRGLGEEGKASGDWLSGGFSTAASGAGILAAGIAAAAAGISALVVTSANEVRELENMARLANMTSQEFAAYAYATEKVGISGEQLADISKDVKDKLGDFIATGGGEFLDFFENVAPKVGLTVQQLQNLSGPDVLVAVKKAMDDVNLSAEEQVFYLEAIGNDASKLIPLLENNGEVLRKNAERAREFGVALSDIDEQKLLDAKDATDDVDAAFGGLKNQVAAEFAPAFTAVMEQAAQLLVEVRGEAVALAKPFANIVQSLAGFVAVGSGRMSLLELAAMDAEELAGWMEKDRQGIVDLDNQIAELMEKRNDIRFSVYDGGKSSGAAKAEIQQEIDLIKAEKQEIIDLVAAKREMERAAASQSGHAPSSTTNSSKTDVDAHNKGREALQKYIQTQRERLKLEYETAVAFAETDEERSKALAKYNDQLAALEKSTVKRMRTVTDKQKDGADEVLTAYSRVYSQVDTVSKQMYDTLLGQYQKDRDTFIATTGDKLVAYEVYAARVAELDAKAGKFEQVDAALEDFFGDLDTMSEKGVEGFGDLENAVSGWASGFGKSLSDSLWDADATFGDMAESFGRMLTEMFVQAQIIKPMLEGLFGSSSGSGGLMSGIGSFFSGLFANAHGNVYDSPSLSAYRNQVVSTPTFFAFASGGVFGEAGPEAIMPLTRTSSGDLGVKAQVFQQSAAPQMTVNIHEASGTKATVQQSNDGMTMDVLIEQLEGAMSKRMSRGTGLASVLDSRYGRRS